jgi:YggT family protein
MSEVVKTILYAASIFLNIYSVLIFIRVVLAWFSGIDFGRLYTYLCRITDPYLFWFSRFGILRTGSIDLSPIVSIAVLRIFTNVLEITAEKGTITISFILMLILSAVWGAVSFIIAFFTIIVIIRLSGYLISANIYSPFWQVIDYISRPVIFNINRILFRRRVVNYLVGIISAIVSLVVLYALLNFIVVKVLMPILNRVPF